MKKHLLFLMALTFAGVSVWAQATITVGPSGADYTTIQEAVDVADPGDIINVAAGIYAENVVVNKAVIIEGPNKNVDPRIAAALRTSGSSAEAIVDGGGSSSPVFEITVAGVVLNGIEIRNGTGDLVSSPSGAPVKTGVIVKYCIVNNAGDEGIQLRNVDGGGVEYCYIHNTIGDGINLSSECTNSYIKNNQVTTSASNDAAIYLYSNGPNMLINNNLVSGVTSANGIMIGIKNGNDANKNSSYANNAIVSNNIVTGHTASGVGVYVNTSRVNIIDNTITNWNSGTNAALYLRFNIKDIIVTGNDISGNNNGIKVSSGVTTSSALTFLINENNLSGNTTWGLTNSSSGAVNATCNWWGTADGSAIAAFISGDAEYLPYSTSDNPVNCDGVGPVVVYEGNTANIRSTHFTIQAGIDAAVAGDVIKVAAGIYNEFVVIDKALTLQGAFSGFPGNDYGRDGSNESVIIPPGNAIRIAPAGTSTYLITINAENVVIDGFTLMDGKDENGKYGANGGVFSGVGSINIQNNRIVGLPKYGIAVHRSAGNVVTSGMIVDVEISTNYITGTAITDLTATWAYAISLSGTIADVLNNVIDQSRVGIAIQPYYIPAIEVEEDGLVQGNIFQTYSQGVFMHVGAAAAGHSGVSGNWTLDNNMFSLTDELPEGIQTGDNYKAVSTRISYFYHDKALTFINNTFDVSNIGDISYTKTDLQGFTFRNDFWHGHASQHTAGDLNLVYTGNTFTSDDFNIYFDRGSYGYPTYPPIEIDLVDIKANNIFTDGSIISGYKLVPPSNVNVINITQSLGYLIIQDAIDEAIAGDVIEVAAGTYLENLVVNKEGLTIKGPNADISAGYTPGTRAAEAVIVGESVVSSDDVTFNGLEFNSPINPSGTKLIQPNVTDLTIHFKNNVFDMKDQKSSAIYNDGMSGTSFEILDNKFKNQYYSGNYFARTIYSKNTFCTIKGNDFEEVQHGIYLVGNSEDASLIEGNRFSVRSLAIMIGNRQNIRIFDNDFMDHAGIYCDGSSNIRIDYNNFAEAVTYALSMRASCGSGIKMNNNSILSAYSSGVDIGKTVWNHSTINTLDAKCNWWGSNAEIDIEKKIAGIGIVDYTPWLLTDDIENPDCRGGELARNVRTGELYATARDAIDAADNGDKIEVYYNPTENLVIDKVLIIHHILNEPLD